MSEPRDDRAVPQPVLVSDRMATVLGAPTGALRILELTDSAPSSARRLTIDPTAVTHWAQCWQSLCTALGKQHNAASPQRQPTVGFYAEHGTVTTLLLHSLRQANCIALPLSVSEHGLALARDHCDLLVAPLTLTLTESTLTVLQPWCCLQILSYQLVIYSRPRHEDDPAGSGPLCPWPADETWAYVLSTSGSTGRPKLVAVSPASYEPNVRDVQDWLQLSHTDVVAHTTLPTFDPAVLEIGLASHAGATLATCPYIWRVKIHGQRINLESAVPVEHQHRAIVVPVALAGSWFCVFDSDNALGTRSSTDAKHTTRYSPGSRPDEMADYAASSGYRITLATDFWHAPLRSLALPSLLRVELAALWQQFYPQTQLAELFSALESASTLSELVEAAGRPLANPATPSPERMLLLQSFRQEKTVTPAPELEVMIAARMHHLSYRSALYNWNRSQATTTAHWNPGAIQLFAALECIRHDRPALLTPKASWTTPFEACVDCDVGVIECSLDEPVRAATAMNGSPPAQRERRAGAARSLVLAAGHDGYVKCMEAASGYTLWATCLPERCVRSSARFWHEWAIFGSHDGHAYALHLSALGQPKDLWRADGADGVCVALEPSVSRHIVPVKTGRHGSLLAPPTVALLHDLALVSTLGGHLFTFALADKPGCPALRRRHHVRLEAPIFGGVGLRTDEYVAAVATVAGRVHLLRVPDMQPLHEVSADAHIFARPVFASSLDSWLVPTHAPALLVMWEDPVAGTEPGTQILKTRQCPLPGVSSTACFVCASEAPDVWISCADGQLVCVQEPLGAGHVVATDTGHALFSAPVGVAHPTDMNVWAQDRAAGADHEPHMQGLGQLGLAFQNQYPGLALHMGPQQQDAVAQVSKANAELLQETAAHARLLEVGGAPTPREERRSRKPCSPPALTPIALALPPVRKCCRVICARDLTGTTSVGANAAVGLEC
ncbi:uncharacterized protein MONBRDRAFT_10108 [Monosiga brevicollis MX1]|uniref:AMP-dependent synthetase/ligase domain-containing protein n=1 Tax=Monosiga brevicollis TaxID=81824 RepID=A9V587_MONBE|nr:uncharacterized protein MONBRDRAFT_10108 [Monosiga brevicollis MX1]EDQ87233.1 predicted protein [Monosiga brevicollis MX1]|eukprot:XP_001747846.1 hypothetical protein [Monosiga brevicollis MX1]